MATNAPQSAEKRLTLSQRLREPLFTHGEYPELDSLKLCCDLLASLPEHMKRANLDFIVDKFGYMPLVKKRPW